MNTAQASGGWRTDLPPVGMVVEVWLINSVVSAVWEGAPLAYITHWRRKG